MTDTPSGPTRERLKENIRLLTLNKRAAALLLPQIDALFDRLEAAERLLNLAADANAGLLKRAEAAERKPHPCSDPLRHEERVAERLVALEREKANHSCFDQLATELKESEFDGLSDESGVTVMWTKIANGLCSERDEARRLHDEHCIAAEGQRDDVDEAEGTR